MASLFRKLLSKLTLCHNIFGRFVVYIRQIPFVFNLSGSQIYFETIVNFCQTLKKKHVHKYLAQRKSYVVYAAVFHSTHE